MMNEHYPASFEAALKKLYLLVRQRNALLNSLVRNVPADRLHPATYSVEIVKTDRLRGLLNLIEEITPQVAEAVEEYNRQAEPIGEPLFMWKSNEQ